ncbi:MAG: class I SAM-dependent DNA methyltransferase [Nanoarchaeota archaeon]
MLAPELKSRINKLWDKFWAGGLANPLTAIEQISYLIFLRRLEDLDDQEAKRAEALKHIHASVFKGHEDCRWSHWKHYNAEDMLVHVRDKVFPFLKNIQKGEDGEFSRQMQDAIFLIPKPSLLQEAVSIVDELNITARNQDTQGDIYEYLLSELNQAGKAGQFRTPRHIIRMMVEIVNPQFGEKICDPACGTAGFLINAYQHILKINTSPETVKYDAEGVAYNLVGDKITDKKQWEALRRNTLYGFDFDPTMVRIASMNMILHGIEHPNIKRFDTLSKAFEHIATYDVILANPPFTGSIDSSDISAEFKLNTTKTELLFLELFHNLLEIGGRCAVIVPNGVLFGSSKAHVQIRKLLLEKCQMEAVISMPSGVFKPYSGVGTAVIVFTKGGQTKDVWFYDMKSDGFSLDDKRDLIDGKGDIPDIVERFKNKQSGENSIIVSFEDIRSNDYNLSISRYKEVKHEEVVYEKPEAIIERVMKREEEITKELAELKRIIK